MISGFYFTEKDLILFEIFKFQYLALVQFQYKDLIILFNVTVATTTYHVQRIMHHPITQYYCLLSYTILEVAPRVSAVKVADCRIILDRATQNIWTML